MACDLRIRESYKTSGTTLSSIKKTVKLSVQENQIKHRENLLLRKRLKTIKLPESEESLTSEEQEHKLIIQAVKSLKKGNKLNTLTVLQRLFASYGSNAEVFLRHEGLQPLHSCFRSSNTDILHTAAWCFINLAASSSSSHSTTLLSLAPTLLQFVKGSDVVMQDLCVWSLANLAGDNTAAADVLHVQGCTDIMINLLCQSNPVNNEERIRNVLFALINLASSSASCVQYMYTKDLHKTLWDIMKSIPADSTLNYELGWLACSLYPGSSETDSSQQSLSITCEISNRLNQLVAASQQPINCRLCFPFVRCLSNLVASNPILSRALLNDITSFKTLSLLLESDSDLLKMESLVLLNNCSVDVVSRVLVALQPDVLSLILLLCVTGELDQRAQTLQLVQAMVRMSSHVDYFLLTQGIITSLITSLSSFHSLNGNLSHDQLCVCKFTASSLLDLLTSQPELTKEKMEHLKTENPVEFSAAFDVICRLQSLQSEDIQLSNLVGNLTQVLCQMTLYK